MPTTEIARRMLNPQPNGRIHPHSHDPELAQARNLASGCFCIVRTRSGRFYACIEGETALGEMHVMIELAPAAALSLARGQQEHVREQRREARASTGYHVGYQDEMTTGAAPTPLDLHPLAHPQGIFAQLAGEIEHHIQTSTPPHPQGLLVGLAADIARYYKQNPRAPRGAFWQLANEIGQLAKGGHPPHPNGQLAHLATEARQHVAAHASGPMAGGLFAALAKEGALLGGGGQHSAGYQDEMTTGHAIVMDHMTAGLFDDVVNVVTHPDKIVQAVSKAVAPVAQAVEHVASPVVHALGQVAGHVAHAIDTAAKAGAHAVDDVVKTGARIVAKAHLGDIDAGKFIKDVVHTAQTGLDSLGHAVDDAAHLRIQKMADGLAKGAVWLAKNVDVPKIVADAIPVPAIRSAAQSLVGLADPTAKFADAVDALRKGDLQKLKAMAQQELAEAQGVVSLVPGVGSGVSAALGAAQALLDGGAPIDIALRSAYGALPIPPGLREITDNVLDAVLEIVRTGNITDAALAVVRDRIPSGVPRDVFDTLVNVIGHHQPIEKAAAQLAGHYVQQYTQGLAPALEHGLASIVPQNVATLVRRLPDPSTVFAGFAPGLKVAADVAKQLKGVPALGAGIRAIGAPGQLPRVVLPLRLGPKAA